MIFHLEMIMNRIIISIFLSLTIAYSALAKPVVAQFISYYDNKEYRLPDATKITHLIFSPARINKDISLDMSRFEKYLDNIPQLKEKNPDLKVSLLIGGARSQNFSEACATPESRAKFLDILGNIIQKYNLDGIDLDWEFPGVARKEYGQNATPQDVDNYTLLMKEYKARFPNKILTVDIGNEVKNLDYANVQKYVDYFHLMSYDYSTIKHNAPLYRSKMTKRASVSESVEKLMKLVPAKKIVMGVPFYGHFIKNPKDVNAQISYESAQEYIKKYDLTLCRDEVAKCPFYIDYDHNVKIICEDEISIREKCRFAKSKKLAGVVAWQHLNDDAQQTLTKAMFDEMNK